MWMGTFHRYIVIADILGRHVCYNLRHVAADVQVKSKVTGSMILNRMYFICLYSPKVIPKGYYQSGHHLTYDYERWQLKIRNIPFFFFIKQLHLRV